MAKVYHPFSLDGAAAAANTQTCVRETRLNFTFILRIGFYLAPSFPGYKPFLIPVVKLAIREIFT